jgi:hypothetical protein
MTSNELALGAIVVHGVVCASTLGRPLLIMSDVLPKAVKMTSTS